MSYTVDVIELRKAMADAEIFTFLELSEKSGVDRNTVSKVVKGTIRPSTAVMEKIATALNLNPSKAGEIFFVPNLRNA